MERLNYQHLFYFWQVVREGSIAAAAERLHLAQPTISAQIKSLEQAVGSPLFLRRGRGLVPTEAGKLAAGYAERIFSLGDELTRSLTEHRDEAARTLRVGLVDAVPKHVALRLLEGAVMDKPSPRLICHEGKAERLLAELASRTLDVVFSDSPVPSTSRVRAHAHRLGDCPVMLFAPEAMAAQAAQNFPGCLTEAPLLLPTEHVTLRRSIDAWLERHSIDANVVGEFEDSALLKVFAQGGARLLLRPGAHPRSDRSELPRPRRRHDPRAP
jgi:LysR family transcriptional activator of nhaA